MPVENENMHLYERTIDGRSNDSLTLIADMVAKGDVLLDLGMGTGALGKYLFAKDGIVADGVTYNPDEEAIANQWYRRTYVLDLDQVDLGSVFQPQTYNCIVCADVIEHLKSPQRLLAACKQLLKPNGRILVSVPNAGYCGLVAELIQGEFRYRPEGLLDATHLRFFTRKSLTRFFKELGFDVVSMAVTQRTLLESEFGVVFDDLPPKVANHLLAMPDALTYQFICELREAQQGSETGPHTLLVSGVSEVPEEQLPIALFSASVYLGNKGQYDEHRKVVCSGRIGVLKQTLVFEIPASLDQYTQIRFDPADRRGFLRLDGIRLTLSDGSLLWEWLAENDPVETLSDSANGNVAILGRSELFSGAALVLTSDDPWIVMPFSADLLKKVSDSGALVQVSLGWPMSSDYLRAANFLEIQKSVHHRDVAVLTEEISAMSVQKVESYKSARALKLRLEQSQNDLHGLHAEISGLQAEKSGLVQEVRTLQQTNNLSSQNFNQLQAHLRALEQSTVFRVSRPLVRLKMQFDKVFRGQRQVLTTQMPYSIATPQLSLARSIDIIVPVYRGLTDTQRCLQSVLSASYTVNWRLIVINDCSPEPEITEWLRLFAQNEPRIVLLENSQNLGFVATVNKGMSASTQNDVILLNSDTEVANDWLDRLCLTAYGFPRVASVTPFSNNATIFSYPGFCQPNDLPVGLGTAELDLIFAKYLAGKAVDVPTGVGFCMYITRACLQEVGLFDVENFGKGYGEENDFCVRAQNAGWRNLHALDTFVRHAGGISFGDSKSARELQAMETLRRLHVHYEREVQAYVQQDPAALARFAIDLGRILGRYRPVILNVVHNRDGGTLRHVQELSEALGEHATFLRLSPAPGGVVIRLEGEQEKFELCFALPQDFSTMVNALRHLRVAHIHFHHLLGHSPEIADLPSLLGVTHDFTAHDYYSYCPQISLTDHTDQYCGEKGLDQCRQCLKRCPAPNGESIDSWRDRHAPLLAMARYVMAPSADAAQRIHKFVPTANIKVVAHSALEKNVVSYPTPLPDRLDANQPLRIVVLGALSKIKGADLLEQVALLAAKVGAPIEFHLLGFAYRNLKTQPKANLTVHGPYEDRELPQLLTWLNPHLVWFPAVWPETYSYTLSASLASGLPIAAPNIGAFSERLSARPWTWQLDWQLEVPQLLEFFKTIRVENFIAAVGPSLTKVPDIKLPTNAFDFSYWGNYVKPLRAAEPASDQELAAVCNQLYPYSRGQSKAPHAPTSIKLTVLKAILRLRTSALLAPLAKLIPLHVQRRVKSWLHR
jgi:GT2 family glycosyltransferase/2-polyprenyl-3-methyl-5-hydroxy-6-metoxy-1,4-benzoquinol methylase/glycosyltransferase involved in cell wall biosynthesis/cell division protein FtsB